MRQANDKRVDSALWCAPSTRQACGDGNQSKLMTLRMERPLRSL